MKVGYLLKDCLNKRQTRVVIMSFLEELANTVDNVKRLGKQITDLPVNERELYRDAVGETFTLLDSAINLMLSRLGTILSIPPSNQQGFIDELYRLNDFKEWEDIERAVSLCQPLRNAGNKLQGSMTIEKDSLSESDRQGLIGLINRLLAGESGFANLISNSLGNLTMMANNVSKSPTDYQKARNAVLEIRNRLKSERKKLIAAETEFYDKLDVGRQ